MEKEEILMTEHNELLEVYKHHWANMYYLGVSYVVVNGVLASLLIAAYSTHEPVILSFFKYFALIPVTLAVVAYIGFIILVKEGKHEILKVISKATLIEKELEAKSLVIDTFQTCFEIKREKFIFNLIYFLASAIVFAWIFVEIIVLYLFP